MESGPPFASPRYSRNPSSDASSSAVNSSPSVTGSGSTASGVAGCSSDQMLKLSAASGASGVSVGGETSGCTSCGATITDTLAVLDPPFPSDTVCSKLTSPEKPLSGVSRIVVPSRVTVPFSTFCTDVIVSGSASGSLSLAKSVSTSRRMGVSNSVTKPSSSAARGAPFTGASGSAGSVGSTGATGSTGVGSVGCTGGDVGAPLDPAS